MCEELDRSTAAAPKSRGYAAQFSRGLIQITDRATHAKSKETQFLEPDLGRGILKKQRSGPDVFAEGSE